MLRATTSVLAKQMRPRAAQWAASLTPVQARGFSADAEEPPKEDLCLSAAQMRQFLDLCEQKLTIEEWEAGVGEHNFEGMTDREKNDHIQAWMEETYKRL